MKKALQLLYLKSKNGTMSNFVYEQILEIFECSGVSLYKAQKYIAKLLKINTHSINMCINSCCAFTNSYATLNYCPYCNESRYLYISTLEQKYRKAAIYFSLQDRLQIQLEDPNHAKKMLYRSTYQFQQEGFADIYNGYLYKSLCDHGFFNEKHDICLIGSCDGYQIF